MIRGDIFIGIFTAELFIFVFSELVEGKQLALCAACLFDHTGKIGCVFARIVESGNDLLCAGLSPSA